MSCRVSRGQFAIVLLYVTTIALDFSSQRILQADVLIQVYSSYSFSRGLTQKFVRFVTLNSLQASIELPSWLDSILTRGSARKFIRSSTRAYRCLTGSSFTGMFARYFSLCGRVTAYIWELLSYAPRENFRNIIGGFNCVEIPTGTFPGAPDKIIPSFTLALSF